MSDTKLERKRSQSFRFETCLGVDSTELQRKYGDLPPSPAANPIDEPDVTTSTTPANESAATTSATTGTDSTPTTESVPQNGRRRRPFPSGQDDSSRQTETLVATTGAERDVLAQLQNVHRLLAEVTDASQAKTAVAAAKAVEIYAKEVRASADILRLAFYFKARAKRRLGEMLQAAKETGGLRGGRPAKTVPGGNRFSSQSKSSATTLKLDDLGISKKESARAQEFASVSEEEFEQILGASGSEELNDVALLRKINATRMRKAGPRAKNAPVPAPPPATPTPQAGAPATLPPLQVPELPFDTKNELLGDFAVFLKKLQKKFPGLSPAQFGALFYEWTSYRDRIERKLTDSGTL